MEKPIRLVGKDGRTRRAASSPRRYFSDPGITPRCGKASGRFALDCPGGCELARINRRARRSLSEKSDAGAACRGKRKKYRPRAINAPSGPAHASGKPATGVIVAF